MSQSSYPIALTDEERDTLTSIISHGVHRAQKITRARILLQADDGKSDSDIAESLGCSPVTPWRTRKKFHERDRLEAIERKLDGDDEARLIALATSERAHRAARWTLRLLSDELVALDEIEHESVSYETVRQVLKKTNYSLSDPTNG